jgi:hypothetical protein
MLKLIATAFPFSFFSFFFFIIFFFFFFCIFPSSLLFNNYYLNVKKYRISFFYENALKFCLVFVCSAMPFFCFTPGVKMP